VLFFKPIYYRNLF